MVQVEPRGDSDTENRGRARGFATPGVEIQKPQRLSEDLSEILITPRSSTRKQSLFLFRIWRKEGGRGE